MPEVLDNKIIEPSQDRQMNNGDMNNTTIAGENPPHDQGFLLGTPKVEATVRFIYLFAGR